MYTLVYTYIVQPMFARQIFMEPTWAMLRVLYCSSHLIGLREAADHCNLSPRGASMVLARLEKAGLARRTATFRRVGYTSQLSPGDEKLFRLLVTEAEQQKLRESAESLSLRVFRVLSWIDPTLKKLKRIRKIYARPS